MTLTLHGQMVALISPHNVPDPTNNVHCSRELISRPLHIHLCPESVKTHVSLDINQWTHVFMRNDGVPTRLRPPYSDPYQVLRKHAKYFILGMNCKMQFLSIDFKKQSSKKFRPNHHQFNLITHHPHHHKHLQLQTGHPQVHPNRALSLADQSTAPPGSCNSSSKSQE